MPNLYVTNYRESDGRDVGNIYVEKSYLIDVYPNLIDPQKAPGLWLWGRNDAGQLGDNTTVRKSSPVQTIAGGTNWKQVSCGTGVTAAIKTDGTLWLWGSNGAGQLADNTTAAKSSPVQTVAGGTNWKQVSHNGSSGAAIKTDGTLWLWGANFDGQLGDNTITNRSSPVQTVTGGTNWKDISCGGTDSCTAAIKTDGTLWLWGSNYAGNLGDNTTTYRSSPVQTIAGGTNWKQVSVSIPQSFASYTTAIKTDGTLWLWGDNARGQLGDNTITSKSSPVQTVAGGTNWKQVSAGETHTAAIKTDGTLWSWGYNVRGQLGDNSTVTPKSSPIQTVAGGTNWKQVSAGFLVTAAIKTDGTLWTWGANSNGELGDATTTDRKSSPVQTIAGGTNWKQVSIGGQAAAIKEGDDF
jgi:alpha-tubulin suppressor-like RCC1 family protein